MKQAAFNNLKPEHSQLVFTNRSPRSDTSCGVTGPPRR
jgi:hypothetical protein